MANEHPFQMLFETLGRRPAPHADLVNRQEYQSLHDILSVPVEQPGRSILLRAPRAGHGKTHLLSRVQFHLAASHEFIPLHVALGSRINAASVTDDVFRQLLRSLPSSDGLCMLDLVSRRLFSMALQPLVNSGEVPCQDREGAVTALRTRPVETFDFHHPNAVTAHWVRENFDILGQRLSMTIAQTGQLPIREVAFWVEILFRFAATPPSQPIRHAALANAIHQGNRDEGLEIDRLEVLLGMLALLMRVVLVADDLDGFSADESSALRLVVFLTSLRHSVERLDVIFSVNQDVWESAFLPRLSSGLVDRLSEVVIELNPLNDGEMIALIESRLPGFGSQVFERLDRSAAGNHARSVIRQAGAVWLRDSSTDQSIAAAPVVIPPNFIAEMLSKPVDLNPKESLSPSEIEPEIVVEPLMDPPPIPVFTPIEEKVDWPSVAPVTIPVFTPIKDQVDWPSVDPVEIPVFIPIEEKVDWPSVDSVAIPDVREPVISQMISENIEVSESQVPLAPPTDSPWVIQKDEPFVQIEAPDADRVDDLLRQFRERYMPGSQ